MKNPITLTLLGNALIEFDPRHYLENPLADIAPILADSDVVFTNFEGSICFPPYRCEKTRHNQYFHGSNRDPLDYLAAINVNLLSLASNHIWDLGDNGVRATLKATQQLGITAAGAGEDVKSARRMATITVGQVKIGLIGIVTLIGDEQGAAAGNKLGYFLMGKGDEALQASVLDQIERDRASVDYLIVHHHFHHYQDGDDDAWQRRFAKTCIDRGASIYAAHGEPVLKPLELYKEGLIFYGLGNFVFHTRAPLGHYPAEVWEGMICQVELSAGNVRLQQALPIVLDEGHDGPHFVERRGYPSLADRESSIKILERFGGA